MKLLVPLLLFVLNANSQTVLQPGFNAKEYEALLSLTFNGTSIADSALRKVAMDPYKREYRSEEVGLLNRWSLYIRPDKVGVIDLRGTVNQTSSWLANFYAAMIPATGSLQLNDSTIFNYQFASDPKAAVHVGWTVSLGHLAPDIVHHIKEGYSKKNMREYLIMGHSQGGALAFLLRSYLAYEQKAGRIPADLAFKTYCSAAPKPGNMYYAYDFDFLTRGGWAFTVVNAADWVPELPFSVQQITDINPTNPLIHTKDALKNRPLLVRVAGKVVYNKLEKKPRKAQRKFQRYLGTLVYKKAIKKVLPQLKEPEYAPSNNYMRAGTPIVLMPDEAYFRLYPESEEKHFTHHMFAPYYYLLKKWYLENHQL